ncbi:MAG TPA: hypothetical protein VND83_03365 [Acidimicrobiales bacterium]|nr:hypothetical protein [Acidimicrobiales bacterium]
MHVVEETAYGPSWDGCVLLDIGGPIGALVLNTPSSWVGHEIDLVPSDPALPHTHSAVRERVIAGHTFYAAVYPRLAQGHYVLEGSGQEVTIDGGRVLELSYDVGVCS